MGFLQLFRSPKLSRWYRTHAEAQEALKNLKYYTKYLFDRIEATQYLVLRSSDFYNNHFCDMKISYAKNVMGVSQSNTPRIYKQFFRLINRRINAQKSALATSKEVVVELQEDLQTVLVDINAAHVIDEGIITDMKDIVHFIGVLHQMKTVIDEEIVAIGDVEREFKNFYHGGFSGTRDEVWSRFTGAHTAIQRFKTLFFKELTIVFRNAPPADIAAWRGFVSSEISSMPIFKDLYSVRKESENIIRLSKERFVSLFHAGEAAVNLPLAFSAYHAGFYVCLNKAEYALRIKRRQSMDDGVRLRVWELRVPESVFKKLFLSDVNSGRSGDDEMEEAYDNSFVLPTSRFPLFNYYATQGLVRSEYH